MLFSDLWSAILLFSCLVIAILLFSDLLLSCLGPPNRPNTLTWQVYWDPGPPLENQSKIIEN